MPTQTPPALAAYGQTDRGLVRYENDDSYGIDASMSVLVIADGLGGLPDGALASSIAVETVLKHVEAHGSRNPIDFYSLFQHANHLVQERGRKINEDLGIGTTLTVAQFLPGKVRIGHVGDSGLVVFTPTSWQQITRDHTMAQDMLERLGPGEHAYIPEYFSHTLTRCIGQNNPLETDIYEIPLKGQERILLFTDGVTKTMNMRELHQMIFSFDDPKPIVKKIIKLANHRGGPDNVTAIVAFVG